MSEQENDMMALLKRMQQQLAFLEKKMDTLIQQTQQPKQPFNRERSWRPKPPWQSRPGQDHRREGQAHFAPKKKPFFGHHRGPA